MSKPRSVDLVGSSIARQQKFDLKDNTVWHHRFWRSHYIYIYHIISYHIISYLYITLYTHLWVIIMYISTLSNYSYMVTYNHIYVLHVVDRSLEASGSNHRLKQRELQLLKRGWKQNKTLKITVPCLFFKRVNFIPKPVTSDGTCFVQLAMNNWILTWIVTAVPKNSINHKPMDFNRLVKHGFQPTSSKVPGILFQR